MVEKLRSWPLVDKVFVSKTSAANEPLQKRDFNEDNIEGTDGSTKDFIEFLNSTKKEVILVILDYAGLTTNVADLKEFVSKQRNITKIIIDRLPITSKVEIYKTEVLLQDQNAEHGRSKDPYENIILFNKLLYEYPLELMHSFFMTA
ncbi:hypothetical protein K501DRAFT_169841 [Backusella circina FSU 941]|nr:hypothetical protein K501DRAFT_169841 [Backusella circina FSU 941]